MSNYRSELKLSDDFFEAGTPISTKSSRRRNTTMTTKDHQRSISEVKGIEMYMITKERKEADENLRSLKNRIKHLEIEHIKLNKTLDFNKQLSSKRNSVRKLHDSFKKGIENAIREKEIETELKKREISVERQKRKEAIERSKKRLIEKNHNTSLEVKAQKLKNEDHLKNRLAQEKLQASQKAKLIFEENHRLRHRRSESANSTRQMIDEEYRQKLSDTKSKSRSAKRQAEELARIEALMEENLKKTILLQDTYYQFLFDNQVEDKSLMTNRSQTQTPKHCKNRFIIPPDNTVSSIPNMKYLDKIIAEISSEDF